MTPIKIMIVQSQSDILADVVAEAIRNAADFELVEDAVLHVGSLNTSLERHGENLDVLIAIGDQLVVPIDTLLAKHPKIVISHIVIGPDAIRLDLRKIGLEQLLSTLRVLPRKWDDTPAGRALEYRVMSRPDAEQNSRVELIPVGFGTSALTAKALRWVDAALLLYHRRNPPAEGDVPGLVRAGRAPIENLLEPQSDGSDRAIEPALNALMEAEQALIAELGRSQAAREPLAALHWNLQLTVLELKVVLLCLAPELDLRYQITYGMLHDDLGRRGATLGLACALLGDLAITRAALGQSKGLVRWRLLQHGAMLPPGDEIIRLESSVVAWLLGDDPALAADPRLRHLLRAHPWPGAGWIRQPQDLVSIQRLAVLLQGAGYSGHYFLLAGKTPDRWRADIEAACADAHLPLLRLSFSGLAGADPVDAEEVGARLARAARSMGAIPVIDLAEGKAEPVALDMVAHLVRPMADARCPVVLIAPDGERLVEALGRDRCHLLRSRVPDQQAADAGYLAAATEAGLRLSAEEAGRLAMTFTMTLDEIDNAVGLAVLEGAASEPTERHFARLTAACRRIASPELPRFAHRVEPVFGVDDVVLPPDRVAQLREMVGQVVHASKVLNSWGFGARLPYGRGVAALFCGPSGTGKTMAALAIARELQTETYIVDLSRVISKYIGESEKNLDAVFSDAERAGAVLLFDEAEALFSKRSEVKDAHDRYANIEVAYLLQRMESFSGLAILTTNFRQNLDQAFLRRLRFVVEFPRPDAGARERIWRQCLPTATPLDPKIDFRYLARQLDLTGGNIQQIAVRAAFAAAGEQAAAVEMRHILAATRAELLKLGLAGAERDLAEYEKLRRPEAVAAA